MWAPRLVTGNGEEQRVLIWKKGEHEDTAKGTDAYNSL